MRWMIALALSAGLLAGSGAQAQSVDLRQMTCGEFVKQDKDFHGQILMWLSGYSLSEDEDPVVDFDSIVQTGRKMGAYCGQHPDASLITAYENAAR